MPLRLPCDDSASESDSVSYKTSDGGDPSRRRDRISRHGRRRSRDSNDDPENERNKSRKNKKKNITEEDIKDYLAKKAEKTARKAAKKLNSSHCPVFSGYTNDSNPFGDSNLNEKFVWRKKIERDIAEGVLSLYEFSVKSEKKRQRERMAEIEKVKKRREERAIEKAQHEEEMGLLARERARAEFQDWEKKEEEFNFEQSRVGTQIRMREGRMKPIDVLRLLPAAELGRDGVGLDKNFAINEPRTGFKGDGVRLDKNFAINEPSTGFKGNGVRLDKYFAINEPSTVFKGLAISELEELCRDIKTEIDNLEGTTSADIRSYWEAVMVACEWELGGAKKSPPGQVRDLQSSMEADVESVLKGKNCGELEDLQSKIELQMRCGKAKVVEFWEAVLKRIGIFKAKAYLKEIHARMVCRQSEYHEQMTEDEDHGTHYQVDVQASSEEPMPHDDDADEGVETEEMAAGSYSPRLLCSDDEDAIDPDEDMANLERRRAAVLEQQQQSIKSPQRNPDDSSFEQRALRSMGAMAEGDGVFGSHEEVKLASTEYQWHDKYRPRKPKYFNRVHTGYEWNKYNQTHYDHDNPPPKVVHGYKFNIFYPDLVDRSKAPQYFIEKDGDNTETCIIRFHAGPPYEDLAFQIVNKEWEISQKKGFKSTFERGILHLYFNFTRYRYRR